MARRQIVFLFALLAAHALPDRATFAAASDNLIVNGDFATERCRNDWSAVTTVPGWTTLYGGPTLVCYTAGTFATPESGHSGRAFLANGPYGDAALAQVIDLAGAARQIDTGRVQYTLTSWLGGWATSAGNAEVTATFLDSYSDIMPMPATLIGGGALARGGQTALLARTAFGIVPVRARKVLVRVRFTGTAPFQSVAYADQLSFTLSTPLAARQWRRPASFVPAFNHVFMLMMENTDYAALIGDNVDAPYINDLARRGTLMAGHIGVYHPSDENYLAVAGGDVFVRGPIYFPHIHVARPQLGDVVEAGGGTWKAYEQGMGTPCNLTSNADKNYAPDDAPFINFTDVANHPVRCAAHLFDTTQLTADLRSTAATPNLLWIAADDYFDGELSGNGSPRSLSVQDGWLRRTLEPIFASPAWRTQRSLLILTWDESQSYSNNHVATILLGSQGLVRSGLASYRASDHYGIGRTIEAGLGLPSLTINDEFAHPFNEAFSELAPIGSLNTTTKTVIQGDRVAFSYTTPLTSLAPDNLIALYPAGASPGQSPQPPSRLVAPNAAGSLSFDTRDLRPGDYAAWYLYDDQVTPLAAPVTFRVIR